MKTIKLIFTFAVLGFIGYGVYTQVYLRLAGSEKRTKEAWKTVQRLQTSREAIAILEEQVQRLKSEDKDYTLESEALNNVKNQIEILRDKVSLIDPKLVEKQKKRLKNKKESSGFSDKFYIVLLNLSNILGFILFALIAIILFVMLRSILKRPPKKIPRQAAARPVSADIPKRDLVTESPMQAEIGEKPLDEAAIQSKPGMAKPGMANPDMANPDIAKQEMAEAGMDQLRQTVEQLKEIQSKSNVFGIDKDTQSFMTLPGNSSAEGGVKENENMEKDQLVQKVFELHQAGQTVKDISQQLRVSTDQINLILKFKP